MNVRHLKIFILSFVAIALLMSVFSEHVSWLASRMLSMTGELRLYTPPQENQELQKDDKKNDPLMPKQVKKGSKQATPKKEDLSRQVVSTKHPKTATPVLRLLPDSDFESFLEEMPPFPEMRLFTGEAWNKEKTDVFGATDGVSLYLRVVCHDSDPDHLVKVFSIAEGSGNCWKDDSVELFLMKDHLSDEYFQFMASSSGKTHMSEWKIRPEDPRMGAHVKGAAADSFAKVFEIDKGYVVEFRIPFSEIKFEQKTGKDPFHMQIVRNYRGEKKDLGAVCLHLFPVYVHGDNRFGECNHYWRAFERIQIKERENE